MTRLIKSYCVGGMRYNPCMKNALILHGTNNNSQNNWFQWLKGELEQLGYFVWVPDLPGANKPNITRYNEFLFSNTDFTFNEETIIIGHSSGAVEILGLLQALPPDVHVHSVYLIGAFKDNLGEDYLSDLFEEPFDFALIKSKSNKFVFFHSDNDPYCPFEHAEYLVKQVDGELVFMRGEAHFSISTAGEKYKQFPELLEKIKKEI
jgi:uncharacterized protein